MQLNDRIKPGMMDYRFTLKDNNRKAYNMFVWFLFFLHIVAAAVFGLNADAKHVKLDLYILLGFYGIIYAVYFLFRGRKNAMETLSLILALLYANFWLKHVGIGALIIFVAVFLFVTVVQGKKTTVFFSGQGVHLTRIFKTVMYPWQQMDNVILKDNVLTIDFISNRIIQAEIADGMETVDEMKFNDFCFDHIHKQDLV